MNTLRILLILFTHELRILAISIPTYVAGAVFLTLMGGLYWFALLVSTSEREYTPLEGWFHLFALPLFFIVPLLTMRSFAEERRLGTLGALFSTPVRPLQVVLAKFSAAYALYLLLWTLALLFPLLAWWGLGSHGQHNDPRLLPVPTLVGGYIFVVASGALHVSVGILASSLTRSTFVAALLTFCALFLLVTIGNLLGRIPFATYSWTSFLQSPSEYLDTFKHLDVFLRGIVDTRPLFFFASGTLLALGLTTLSVESKT
ncbi:MAG: ABC transporter permease [Puniceicoccales bacterium]|jgi:ABC-2 type transport system permease protein|nr:ABC transporter permease [Puniceicoccales bacterium]